MTSNKFFYFAYGSNLLKQRIHINNPSAVRVGIGKLIDYQLDFLTYSKRWRGASATIVPKKGSHVWGALWEIDMKHMACLDEQEGVADKIYFPLMVAVTLPDGSLKTCRVYQQCATPDENSNVESLPSDRRPSAVYLNTIIKGAEESELPTDYIEYLKKIPHNGYTGSVEIELDLKLN